MIEKCDEELGIGPCSVCERERRMISDAARAVELFGEDELERYAKNMNLFSEGQTVVDIFDETQTEWIVWEQKDKWVMVFVPSGTITIKPAAHLHVVKMN